MNLIIVVKIVILIFNHSDKFFYSENIIESHILLGEEESVHCIKVLRLTIGDKLMVTDGRGQIANCILIDTNTKSCKLEIISKKYIKHTIGNKIHIAISPTKHINRFEWFLEKTVELGIREITPILTQRSERDKLNVDRIHKKMITALKQSNNAFLPLLNPLVKFGDFIRQRNDVQKFICHIRSNIRIFVYYFYFN